MELQVPAGASSGDTLLIETASVKMEFEIPAGLSEGDAFTVELVDDSGSELVGDSSSQRLAEPHVDTSLQTEPEQGRDVSLLPAACTAALGLDSVLKQAKQYAKQHRCMQEQLAAALPPGVRFPEAATTPIDALLAWLRTFPSVTISWCASLRLAAKIMCFP